MNEKTLNVLEWAAITEKIKSYTKTPLSKELCKNVNFEIEKEEIKKLQSLTTEAKWLLDNLLIPPFDNIFDIEENIKKTKIHTTLDEIEIYEIAKTMQSSRYLYNFFEKNQQNTKNLYNMAYFLFNNKIFEDAILEKFTPQGKIKENATPKLKALHQSLFDKSSNLKESKSAFKRIISLSSRKYPHYEGWKIRFCNKN